MTNIRFFLTKETCTFLAVTVKVTHIALHHHHYPLQDVNSVEAENVDKKINARREEENKSRNKFWEAQRDTFAFIFISTVMQLRATK